MFPFAIHSDTIANWELLIVTPNSDSTFGWRRVFHVTTSLQNLYVGKVSWPTQTFGNTVGTHGCHFVKVARRVNPQHFNCNVATSVFTPPHVGVPATI